MVWSGLTHPELKNAGCEFEPGLGHLAHCIPLVSNTRPERCTWTKRGRASHLGSILRFLLVSPGKLSLFPRLQPWKTWTRSCCNQPSYHHVGKPARERCLPQGCRVERFRKKPVTSLGLSDHTMPTVRSIPRFPGCLSQYIPLCLSLSEMGFSCWQLRVPEDTFLMALICKCYHSCSKKHQWLPIIYRIKFKFLSLVPKAFHKVASTYFPTLFLIATLSETLLSNWYTFCPLNINHS